MKRKIIDFDTSHIVPPWEQDDIDKAKKVAELQSEYFEREKKEQKEEAKEKKLAEKKITKKEEKELEEKADTIKKLYALDYWMRCFNRVSYFNEISGQALFHTCLGQALNTLKIYLEDDSELDWRLHYLWIQDSGSGKGKATPNRGR